MATVDPGFGVDEFNRSKILSEAETIKNNILTLLFMRKGSYPSIPELGIGLQDYLYQFFDEIDVEKIKRDIGAQCSEFIPSVNSGELQVVKTYKDNKPVLLVVIPTSLENSNGTSLVLSVMQDATGEIKHSEVYAKLG